MDISGSVDPLVFSLIPKTEWDALMFFLDGNDCPVIDVCPQPKYDRSILCETFLLSEFDLRDKVREVLVFYFFNMSMSAYIGSLIAGPSLTRPVEWFS